MGEWLRDIQTRKRVCGCASLHPKRSGRETFIPERERVRAKPQTLKGVGVCETANPKRSGRVRNPEPQKEWVGAKPRTL